MTLASTAVLGVVGALVMYLGAHQVVAGRLTPGGYVTYVMFLAFMIAPIVQLVSIGTQLTEALAGLDRTTRDSERAARRIQSRARHCGVGGCCAAMLQFDDVEFEYEAGKPVLHGISFEAQPGTVTALVGSCGSGKSTIISLICGFHTATGGTIAGGWGGPGDGAAEQLSAAAGRGAAGDVSVRWDDPGERAVFAAGGDGGAVDGGLPDCAGG